MEMAAPKPQQSTDNREVKAVPEVPVVKRTAKAVENAEPLGDLAEVLESRMLTHRWWLRDDIEVTVDLPADMTGPEAERLAIFIKMLPRP